MRSVTASAVLGGFVPARLTLARQAKGLKQKDLATELGCAPATISKWESEGYGQAPERSKLEALAAYLDVSFEWFFKPHFINDLGPAFYRSMRSELTIAREKAAAKLQYSYELFQSLDRYVEFPTIDIPDLGKELDYRTLSLDEIEKHASRLREYWGLGDDPISDLMVLIENAGIVVAETFLDSVKLDGVSSWIANTPVILLAKDKGGGVRRRFDAAHELGHILLHRHVTQRDVSRDLQLIEEQAMAFAGALLLPASSFAANAGKIDLDHFADIKPKWGVSVGAMIKRLANMNLISSEHEKNLWKYYSYRKWRGNEPHDEHIAVERPDNLKSAIDMLIEEDRTEAVRAVGDSGIGLSFIDELTGANVSALRAPPQSRPKLKLVRSDAAND